MSLISLQFLVTLNVYNRSFHFDFWQKTIFLHRWKFISKQQKANTAIYLQYTELILTIQPEMLGFFFSFITSKRYILSSFICSFPQPTPSFLEFVTRSKVLLCLYSHMAGQLTDPDQSPGGWCNIKQFRSFCLSLKEMIKSCLLSPSATSHKSVGKEHLPNEVITDWEIQKLLQESTDRGRSTAQIAFPEKN